MNSKTVAPEIEEQAIAKFVDDAKKITAEQRKPVIERLRSMARRGERAKLGAGWISCDGLARTADLIEALQ